MMWQSKRGLYVLILSVVLAALSCKKIAYTVPIWNIPAELGQCFLFKPGSYIVYKDSISGKTDSNYITSDVQDTAILNADDNSFYIENGSSIVKSATVVLGGGSHGYNDFIPGSYTCSTMDGTGKKANPIEVYSSNTVVMFYPFNESYIQTSPFSLSFGNFIDTLRLKILTNYSFNGFTFPKVLRFEHTSEILYNIHHTYRYFAPGVGLIQFQLADSSINYKVVSYHVQ